MKRAVLILLISLILIPPVCAQDNENKTNLIVWKTSGLQEKPEIIEDVNSDALESDYLTDEETQALSEKRDAELLEEQEKSVVFKKEKDKKVKKEKKIEFELVQIADESKFDDGVLKGYAEYKENTDAVYLKDDNNQFVLNLKKPATISTTSINLNKSKIFVRNDINLSKYTSDEYKISSNNYEVRSNINDNFSFGTSYDSGISRSQLEKSADFFAEYRYKKFALSTAYERYSAAMYGGKYYDSLYLTPSFKLNKNVSIKEVLGTSLTSQTKTAELVLQVSPFAHKGNDRLNFEVGAKQYFDETNAMYRTRIRFSTMFKL